MSNYRVKQPGDILVLREELPNAAQGFYVLLDPTSTPVRLCLVGEHLETGQLIATAEMIEVEPAALSLFEQTGISAEIDVQPSSLLRVEAGDILEPLYPSVEVPVGLYQVVETHSSKTILSRLHTNEDGKLATTGRISHISSDTLHCFRRLHIVDDLRA